MFIRKSGNGNYYLVRRKYGIGRTVKSQRHKNIYLVKANHNGQGLLKLNGSVYFPKEFIGGRVRFRIEIVDNAKRK